MKCPYTQLSIYVFTTDFLSWEHFSFQNTLTSCFLDPSPAKKKIHSPLDSKILLFIFLLAIFSFLPPSFQVVPSTWTVPCSSIALLVPIAHIWILEKTHISFWPKKFEEFQLPKWAISLLLSRFCRHNVITFPTPYPPIAKNSTKFYKYSHFQLHILCLEE